MEYADGVVNDGASWEQLVVAAQQVTVSTTQLASASRVKTQLFSRTQTQLEEAAVVVRLRTCCKALVKSAVT